MLEPRWFRVVTQPAPLPPKPAPPMLTQKGDITGNVEAGGRICQTDQRSITAEGKITGHITAGRVAGGIWAAQDITGNIQTALGELAVYTWGRLAGAVHTTGANADIKAWAFGGASGEIRSDLGAASLESWGKITSTVASWSDLHAWSSRDVSAALTSQNGSVDIITNGTFIGDLSAALEANIQALRGKNIRILRAERIRANVTGLLEHLEFSDYYQDSKTVLLYCGGDIVDLYVPAQAGLEMMSVVSKGNVSGAIVASDRVTVNCLGDARDLTIGGDIQDMSIGGSAYVTIAAANVSGSYKGRIVEIGATGDFIGQVSAWVSTQILVSGNVTTAEGHKILASHPSPGGGVQGQVVIVCMKNMDALVETATGASITCSGEVLKPVTSTHGGVIVESQGDVKADLSGFTGVSVVTWKSVMGEVTSEEGSVSVFAAIDIEKDDGRG